jgi:hypothetical protein
VWRSWTGPDTVAVRVLWSLPDSAAFFGARAAAKNDPDVAAFWSRTDAMALDRDRQVLEPVDVDGEVDVDGDVAEESNAEGGAA